MDGRQLAQARDGRGSDPQVGSFSAGHNLAPSLCAESWLHVRRWEVSEGAGSVCVGYRWGAGGRQCWECRRGAEQLLDICGRAVLHVVPALACFGLLWVCIPHLLLWPGHELWAFPQAQLAGSPMGLAALLAFLMPLAVCS